MPGRWYAAIGWIVLAALALIQSLPAQTPPEILIRNGLIVTEAGQQQADLRIRGEDIVEIGRGLTAAAGVRTIDATGKMVQTDYDIKLQDYELGRFLTEAGLKDAGHGKIYGRIQLSAGRSRFQLGALPREDFPAMTAGNLPHAFSLPASDLKRLIDKTRFAISSEETRYYLNGIYLHAAKGKDGVTLRAVATDGHRLARFDLTAPAGSESAFRPARRSPSW